MPTDCWHHFGIGSVIFFFRWSHIVLFFFFVVVQKIEKKLEISMYKVLYGKMPECPPACLVHEYTYANNIKTENRKRGKRYCIRFGCTSINYIHQPYFNISIDCAVLRKINILSSLPVFALNATECYKMRPTPLKILLNICNTSFSIQIDRWMWIVDAARSFLVY